MKLTDAEVRELFQRKTARDATSAAECLDADLLVRAASGKLDDAERERVASHIAGCSDCAREFRIARAFGSPKSEESHSSWFPIAASILLALTLPLLAWMVMLRQRDAATIDRLRNELASLSVAPAPPPAVVAEAPPRIDIDTPIIDLDADITRGATKTIIDVPRSANTITLILHLPQETRAPIDIQLAGQTTHLPGGKPRSSVTIGIPRTLLAEGAHAIRLRWNGKQTTYPFRVRYP